MRELTRRQVALIATAVLLVAALMAGVYGLVTGPSPSGAESRSPAAAVTAGHRTASNTKASDPTSAALPRTNDPIAYARAVAAALFDWDPAAGFLPADYQAPVLADADPSGEETPGLITDTATYMPTVDQWLDLGAMNVTQTLSIRSAAVPASWATAVAQAHGELRPGSTAVTIEGTRQRTGIWNGATSSTSSPVSFTVFVACAPAFDRCRVLRLSQLDNPLR
jgi:hypothetical protein